MGRKLGNTINDQSTEIVNTAAFGQVNTQLPVELFKPAIVIVRRSFNSETMAGLLRKSFAEYLMKNYKEREILGMVAEYDKIENKPKHWY